MKSVLKKYIPFTIGQKLRGFWQKFQSILLSGSNYYCPYCKNSFRKFLPGGSDLPVIIENEIIGAGLRENCVCPRCYSTDRDRLLYLYLHQKTNIFKEKTRILHIAPSGSLAALLSSKKNIDYHTGIKHHEGFYYSKETQILDITAIPHNDNDFDVIICNHVLEHVIEDRKAMSEIFRVLKPGGWAILQVPISKTLEKTFEDNNIIDPKEREKYFGQFDHVRIYGQDYPDRLSEIGFNVEVIDIFFENIKDIEIEKLALNKKEKIYIGHKPINY